MTGVIDQANVRAMRSRLAVRCYAGREDLLPQERAALDSVEDLADGQAILDIGVGAGRTTKALVELSSNYIGVDYSPAMIAACRHRYPGVDFRHMDARHMDTIQTGSIALAVFSCNGVCMVDHHDRLEILREVFRVLKPGGAFLFSTFNQDSPQHTAGFRFPRCGRSRNPLKQVFHLVSFAAHAPIALMNRAKLAKHEVRTPDYSIINDVYHDYGTMEYYISLGNQRRQLEACGFAPEAVAYDKEGREITAQQTAIHEMFFVARKPN